MIIPVISILITYIKNKKPTANIKIETLTEKVIGQLQKQQIEWLRTYQIKWLQEKQVKGFSKEQMG